jgi:hypothetical protein
MAGNLKFQVGALRRALGDGRGGRRYIATSAGQGYRFVAPVSVAQAPAAAALPAAPTRQNHNLPQQLTRLIGRADAASRIMARLQQHRLLSILDWSYEVLSEPERAVLRRLGIFKPTLPLRQRVRAPARESARTIRGRGRRTRSSGGRLIG